MGMVIEEVCNKGRDRSPAAGYLRYVYGGDKNRYVKSGRKVIVWLR